MSDEEDKACYQRMYEMLDQPEPSVSLVDENGEMFPLPESIVLALKIATDTFRKGQEVFICPHDKKAAKKRYRS